MGCQRLSCSSTVIGIYQLLIVDVLQIRKVGWVLKKNIPHSGSKSSRHKLLINLLLHCNQSHKDFCENIANTLSQVASACWLKQLVAYWLPVSIVYMYPVWPGMLVNVCCIYVQSYRNDRDTAHAQSFPKVTHMFRCNGDMGIGVELQDYIASTIRHHFWPKPCIYMSTHKLPYLHTNHNMIQTRGVTSRKTGSTTTRKPNFF